MTRNAQSDLRTMQASILLVGLVASLIALLFPHWYEWSRLKSDFGRHSLLSPPPSPAHLDSVRLIEDLVTAALLTFGLLRALKHQDSPAFIQPLNSFRVRAAALVSLALPQMWGYPVLVMALELIASGGIGSMYAAVPTIPALLIFVVPFWLVYFVVAYLIMSVFAKSAPPA